MILFHHISKTMDFIEKINFKCNGSNKIDLFSDFLLNCINDNTYYNITNYYIKKLKSIEDENYIKKNLRMSLI